MRTVHKATIGVGIGQTYVDVELPKKNHPFHVAWQKQPNDVVNIWYQLDDEDPKTEKVRFQVFGTGDGPIPRGAYYRGTAIEPTTESNRHGVQLVMHVFELELEGEIDANTNTGMASS